MRFNCLTIVISLLLGAASALAQDIEVIRPVTSSYCVEWGSSHLADTYLTPLHYRGYGVSLAYERNQAMKFNPERWIMQLKGAAYFDRALNPAKNATMINGELQLQWSMMHRWNVGTVMLAFGGNTGIDGGALYLSRNGNNPASAQAAWTLGVTGMLSWKVKVWRVPLTLRYQPTMPLTGVFFSPDYGQLYYQILLGQRENLVHAAWPGNFFRLDNLVTADLHFGNTSLRIGYHGRIFSSKANNIVTQNINHALVLGITIDWMSLRPGDKLLNNAKLINYNF